MRNWKKILCWFLLTTPYVALVIAAILTCNTLLYVLAGLIATGVILAVAIILIAKN